MPVISVTRLRLRSARFLPQFMCSKAHKRAMPRLANWCSESTSVHWDQENDQLPDWKQAYDRLVRDGWVIYVKNPSQYQKERKFPEPRLAKRLQQELNPRAC